MPVPLENLLKRFRQGRYCLTLSHIQTFSDTCKRLLLKTLWQKKIAQNEQFLLLPHCFQLYSIIKVSFIEIFQIVSLNNFKVICCRFLVCWKGIMQGISPFPTMLTTVTVINTTLHIFPILFPQLFSKLTTLNKAYHKVNPFSYLLFPTFFVLKTAKDKYNMLKFWSIILILIWI